MIDNILKIEDSNEYLEYKKIGKILEKDPNISSMMSEIKDLQKESNFLENNNDLRYKELDKIIEEKVAQLNSNSVYQEYLEEIKKFNSFINNKTN